jgi:hypothetical protein
MPPFTRGALYAFAFFAFTSYGQQIPNLDIVSVGTDPVTQHAKAKLFNTSHKAAIASVIAVSCPAGTAFALEDAARAGEDATGVHPDDTADRQLPCSPVSDVRVVAVVYDDRTAEGNPAQIEQIFAHRRKFVATIKAERTALAESPDVPTALTKLHMLKGVDEALTQNTEAELREKSVSYEDLKAGLMAEFDRDLPAAEANAKRTIYPRQ